MIAGIGTDLCAVERLAKSLEKPAFCQRVYAPQEQALLDRLHGRRRLETAAANYAAKEAFLKAAGTGLGGFALAELAVLREPNGAPRFALTGAAAAWAQAQGLTAHVSLSHDGGLAAAFVVLERRGAP